VCVTEKKEDFHKKIFTKRFLYGVDETIRLCRLNSIYDDWMEFIIIIYNISPFLLFLYGVCGCVCVSQKKIFTEKKKDVFSMV
jgi:hypothetical protein